MCVCRQHYIGWFVDMVCAWGLGVNTTECPFEFHLHAVHWKGFVYVACSLPSSFTDGTY